MYKEGRDSEWMVVVREGGVRVCDHSQFGSVAIKAEMKRRKKHDVDD